MKVDVPPKVEAMLRGLPEGEAQALREVYYMTRLQAEEESERLHRKEAEAERKRALAILRAALPDEFDVARQAVLDGVSVGDAVDRFAEARKVRRAKKWGASWA